MKIGIHIPRVHGRLSCKPVIKHLAGMVSCLVLLIWTSGTCTSPDNRMAPCRPFQGWHSDFV